MPGGTKLHAPDESTMIFVGKALLNSGEAELYISKSGVQILEKKN
jgi:hypothetical protein